MPMKKLRRRKTSNTNKMLPTQSKRVQKRNPIKAKSASRIKLR